MKHSDENPLLKEILTDDKLSAVRHASLNSGLDTVRRARRFHRAMRAGTLALLPVLLILTLTLHKPTQEIASQSSIPGAQQSNIVSALPRESGVKTITDEELFALFPGHSLALIGKAGQQKLVLLDEPVRH